MKHYCNGEVIYLRDEDIWYCQRCGTKHIALEDFENDNLGYKMSEVD